MFVPNFLPDSFSVSEEDQNNITPSILLLLTDLIKQNIELKARMEQLEERLNISLTTSKPPS